ncbi:MAG: hypothetical protein APR55_02680 [Methanolinea sp. SDB]|nr:MAG: hypothetical protein APR55_02680 [Methanolinea sp. SDB]
MHLHLWRSPDDQYHRFIPLIQDCLVGDRLVISPMIQLFSLAARAKQISYQGYCRGKSTAAEKHSRDDISPNGHPWIFLLSSYPSAICASLWYMQKDFP